MNERFNLVLESSGEHLIPAVTRLRGLLKLMLRGFGLRCVEAREIVSDAENTTSAADIGNRHALPGG